MVNLRHHNPVIHSLGIPKTVLAVVLVSILAVAGVGVSRSAPEKDTPIGPLTVLGVVYDVAGRNVSGATVLVEIVETGAKRTETTDSEGKYQTADFKTSEYEVGYTVHATATYGSLSAENSTKITEEMMNATFVQVDVHFAYEIPEFGSLVGVVLAGTIVAGVAVMALSRRWSRGHTL